MNVSSDYLFGGLNCFTIKGGGRFGLDIESNDYGLH